MEDMQGRVAIVTGAARGLGRAFAERLITEGWDSRGQDLIEYALMAGFVAIAAGSIMPGVSTSISTIFSMVASSMSRAAAAS